jgi:hypothetical protein
VLRRWRSPILSLASLFVLASCRRSPSVRALPDAGPAAAANLKALCLQQSDGCVWCVTRERESAILEAEQSRPTLCDPRDPDNCVEFCTGDLTPDCALSWRTDVPGCVFDSEGAFYRAVFERDTSDRPEVVLNGRVVDEAGHRVEGAAIRVWATWRTRRTELYDPPVMSGKDGGFRLVLRGGPLTYLVRVSHPGLATEMVDKVTLDRIDRTGQPRIFRLGPEHLVRGKVLDGESGTPLAGATVWALRTPEDMLATGEALTADDGSFAIGGLEPRRYFLRTTKFGWRSLTQKSPVTAPATRISVRLERTTVVTGVLREADGEPARNAWMRAWISGAPGLSNLSYTWMTDEEGRFAEELTPGTYYVWARRGDMLIYPPEKIELQRGREAEVNLALNHRGARVSGQVMPAGGFRLGPEARVVLLPASPLATPRSTTVGADHSFVVANVLPGKYEISVRDGFRALDVVQGSHDVEVPIEPESRVTLREPVVVRPQASSE